MLLIAIQFFGISHTGYPESGLRRRKFSVMPAGFRTYIKSKAKSLNVLDALVFSVACALSSELLLLSLLEGCEGGAKSGNKLSPLLSA